MSKTRKLMAILLVVLFLVTVTAGAVSAMSITYFKYSSVVSAGHGGGGYGGHVIASTQTASVSYGYYPSTNIVTRGSDAGIPTMAKNDIRHIG